MTAATANNPPIMEESSGDVAIEGDTTPLVIEEDVIGEKDSKHRVVVKSERFTIFVGNLPFGMSLNQHFVSLSRFMKSSLITFLTFRCHRRNREATF